MAQARGEQVEGDEDGGGEEDKKAEGPHERAGENLLFERSEAEQRGRGVVRRIENTITKGQECAEGATGKCAEEKIERNGPARPTWLGGKGLHDGPPEENGSAEEAEVFAFVPGVRAQSEFECGRNVPGEESDGGENPTDQGMSEKFAERLYGRPAEERAERGADQPSRKSAE